MLLRQVRWFGANGRRALDALRATSALDWQFSRASGPGGQHVNTTESAVRLTHTPTGIKVSCQSERSQHQNTATAMRVLRARLAAHDEEVRKAEHDAVRGEQASTGARSERIRTYNFPDDRVTDHRLDGSKFGLPRMLTTAETLDELVED